MLEIILWAFQLLIAFGCGYGVRELLSRRRRAIEREKFYQRNPEKRPEEAGADTPILDAFYREARGLARDIAVLPGLIEQGIRKMRSPRANSGVPLEQHVKFGSSNPATKQVLPRLIGDRGPGSRSNRANTNLS